MVYTLGEHFDEKAFTDEFGYGTTFPQVICDGKKIGGTVETVKFLREQKSSPSEFQINQTSKSIVVLNLSSMEKKETSETSFICL